MLAIFRYSLKNLGTFLKTQWNTRFPAPMVKLNGKMDPDSVKQHNFRYVEFIKLRKEISVPDALFCLNTKHLNIGKSYSYRYKLQFNNHRGSTFDKTMWNGSGSVYL